MGIAFRTQRHQSRQIGGIVALAKARQRDQRARTRIGQQEIEFAWRRPGTERRRHRADRGTADAHFQPLDAIADQHGDAVALLHAGATQGTRHFQGTCRQLRIAQFHAGGDHGSVPGITPGLLIDKVEQIAAVGRAHGQSSTSLIRSATVRQRATSRRIRSASACSPR